MSDLIGELHGDADYRAFMHRRQALMHRARMHCGRLYGEAMNDLNAGAERYIRFVLDSLNLSPTKLAKEAGIASSTLTRFLNDPQYKFTVSTTTIEKIAKYSGINPARFLESKTQADIAQAAYFHNGEIYDSSWGDQSGEPSTKTTVVIGEVAAGNWREMEILDIMEQPPLAVDLSFYDSKDCFAVVVRGESINKIARDGDYLLCVRRDAMRSGFRSGDLAIVQRSREGGRLIEVTAKRLKNVDGFWELWPVSDDERFQKPLVAESLDDTQEISFVGLVEFVVRRPNDA